MNVYSLGGKGPPLLFLHGSPSSPRAFEFIARKLSKNHRVMIGILPGYAGVPRLVPYDLDRLHEGMEATLRAESDEAWALVGFSMGAHRVLSVALRGNVRVRAVASLAGLAAVPEELRPVLRETAAALRVGALPPETFPPRLLSPAFLAAHPESRAEVRAWLDVTTRDVLADELTALSDAPSLLPALSRAEWPLLLRTGELDVATPPAWSEAIARAVPHAKLEIVPNSGHALLLEDAESTAAALLEFLRER